MGSLVYHGCSRLVRHGLAVLVLIFPLIFPADNRTESSFQPIKICQQCTVVCRAMFLRGGTSKRKASSAQPRQAAGKAARKRPAKAAAKSGDLSQKEKLLEEEELVDGFSDFDLDEIDEAAKSMQKELMRDQDKRVKVGRKQSKMDAERQREENFLAGRKEEDTYKFNDVVKSVDAKLKSTGKNDAQLAHEQQELFDAIAKQLKEDGVRRADFQGTQIEDITERTAQRLKNDDDDVIEGGDEEQEEGESVGAQGTDQTVKTDIPREFEKLVQEGAENRKIFEFSSGEQELNQLNAIQARDDAQVPCLDVDNEMKEGIQKGDELANELAKKFGMKLDDETSEASNKNAPQSSELALPELGNNEDAMSRTMTDGSSVPFLEGVNDHERKMNGRQFLWPDDRNMSSALEDDFWNDCSYTFQIDEWCGEPKTELIQPGRKENMTDEDYWRFLEDEAERYFKYIGLDPSTLQSVGSYRDLPSILRRENTTEDSGTARAKSPSQPSSTELDTLNKEERERRMEMREQEKFKHELETQLTSRNFIRKLEGDSSDTWVDSQGERRKRAAASPEERIDDACTPSMMGLVPGSKPGKGVGIGKAPPVTCIDDLRYRGLGFHEFEYKGIGKLAPVIPHKVSLLEAQGKLPKGTTGVDNISEMNFNLFDRIRYNITRDPQEVSRHIKSAHIRPHVSAMEFLGIKNASVIPPAPAYIP
uniref:Uncharacterized protein n=1 Tax=Hanusia phi TaxID=3032 RepID=A0A7S0ENR5_9CRYP|mmetsp:Transcript_28490/g.64602  ORF Transcript_28490/g.64602 Transcript_28490/m.64602 type:complete len:705 (+) Transcript_28490:137-2251(+)